MKTSLEALIREGRSAVEKQDDELIKSASERLEKEAHQMASTMYGAAGGGPSAGTDAPPKPPPPKGVIDAEFEDAPPA